MALRMNQSSLGKGRLTQRLLEGLNLRPEEGERTFLMFAFSTATSIGLIWIEAIAVGLFLDEYGASSLPWIYVIGAAIGSLLGIFYSWLENIMPLRRAIVAVAVLMAVPLLLFRLGLELEGLMALTIFSMRLWIEAIYILNDLNISITANQLFNIREIKRTYPLISSGILVADVVSGFSLPLLISLIGVKNMAILASGLMLLGAALLFYVGETYQQAFPDHKGSYSDDEEHGEFTARRIRGPLQKYALPLFGFFICTEVLYLLIDFQFLTELEAQSSGVELAGQIAIFLGVFNGSLGICELLMQWFLSSRITERFGVFVTAAVLPAVASLFGIVSLGALIQFPPYFFVSLLALKFLDELLHYTLNESNGPVLFQPLPDSVRSSVQALVNGVARPVATGVTGVVILVAVWTIEKADASQRIDWLFDFISATEANAFIFLSVIVLVALSWLVCVWLLRSGYVSLLVTSAQRGRLGVQDVDMRAFKRAAIETLEQPGTEADKRSCIELLSQIEPTTVGEILAPLLPRLTPALQRQSLEAILQNPSPTYMEAIRTLKNQKQLAPEVLALTLRYLWLVEKTPNIDALRPYLHPEVDPVVRGTAASIVLRRGSRDQRAEATNAIRQMLVNKQERERVMGTRALGEADYLQALRLYIPSLLQDESLRVRCALLEVIASTHYEEYYPSLLKGLYYKSTRDAAMRALVRLGNEAIARLTHLAQDIHKPSLVRMYAWSAIGQIGTPEALDALVANLTTAWGDNRRNILQVLLKMPQETGIEGVLDRTGRSGVEALIDQELMFIGQIYAARLDLSPTFEAEQLGAIAPNDPDRTPSNLSVPQLLYRALQDSETDAVERLFLLMKFLYPLGSIQAAAFNLKSGTQGNMARGLEILDNTLDIPNKRGLLRVLETLPASIDELTGIQDKLESLDDLVAYVPLSPSDRLRYLLELRHFLSDWSLACCYHLARTSRWSLTPDQTLAGLRHPTGFVREAVLSYLQVASPRTLEELLPMFQDDPDRLVAAQVQRMLSDPHLHFRIRGDEPFRGDRIGA